MCYACTQGCSHAFNIVGAQASKIILGPFCLKYWWGPKPYFYYSLSKMLGPPAHSKTALLYMLTNIHLGCLGQSLLTQGLKAEFLYINDKLLYTKVVRYASVMIK